MNGKKRAAYSERGRRTGAAAMASGGGRAVAAVLLGGGGGDERDGHDVGSPVVVTACIGVTRTGGAKCGVSVLRRGRRSSGRRFRRDLGGKNMSTRCASASNED